MCWFSLLWFGVKDCDFVLLGWLCICVGLFVGVPNVWSLV